jgi:NADH dehydrogenase FAD-containing subunit
MAIGTETKKHVVILGAGFAGLELATRLGKLGVRSRAELAARLRRET